MMSKCAEKGCDLEVYDNDKCILHCEKDAWDGDTKKLKDFWVEITKIIDKTYIDKSSQLNQSKIPENGYSIVEYNFKNINFPSIIDNFHFSDLKNDIEIIFNNCKFLGNTNFNDLQRAMAIKFISCHFCTDVEFKNIVFNQRFIFKNCTVHKKATFENITFQNTTSFIETKFKGETNFIYTKFESLALFNSSQIKLLNFENTFFKDEANFLNMKVKVTNRETARIIKYSLEKQNNIIEANKYYALEMDKYKEKLKNKIFKEFYLKILLEYLIFWIHKISSNHSQNWYLALFWICVISFMGIGCNINDSYYILIFHQDKIDVITKSFQNLINIKETNHFILTMVLSYLIYQFIVSIRQNTRRK